MVNNKLNISALINNTEMINEEYISHLQKILLEYPYFQTGQLILTKGFLTTNHYNYNKQLRKAAAYSINRDKLFNIIKNIEGKEEREKKKNLIEFKENEYYSFSQWLALTKVKKITKNNLSEINNQDNIINDFINKKATINKQKKGEFFKPSQAAQESLLENKEIITPTLARIYLEQEHYEKALIAYKKLSLKYPKKSSFFASQIEIINKKIKTD